MIIFLVAVEEGRNIKLEEPIIKVEKNVIDIITNVIKIMCKSIIFFRVIRFFHIYKARIKFICVLY